MIKTLIIMVLFVNTIYAVSLDEILSSALAKSPSLESINAKIEANRESVAISDQFSNPIVTLNTNTLDASQAMSQTLLSLKQRLPYYSKRDTRESVALAEGNILDERLNLARVALVAEIKREAYTLWSLRELFGVIESYISLTKQNIELYESYATVSDNKHMGLMKAKLSLSDLKIQKSLLNAEIKKSYARLSYLASFEIKHLTIELSMGSKPDIKSYKSSLQSSPAIKLKESELLKQSAKVALADIESYPDIDLIAGYAYRENFDNYFNIGVALSLPVYGTEEHKEQKERLLVLEAESLKKDTSISLNATLKIYIAEMLSSYEVYHIIKNNALAELDHMFDLSNSSISTGSDLFEYIDTLFIKLSLEKKSIDAITKYNLAQAKISQLMGALQ